LTTVAGILILIVGVAYPMAALIWLNGRLGRQPALAARHVGRIVAFNGVFPLSLIGLGVGLLSTGLWASLAFKMVLALTGLVSLVLLLILLPEWPIIRGGGDRGRDAPGTGV